MIQIRPVSDLRNKYPEIEALVEEGQPVFLTKNGRGKMVVLNLEQYAGLTDQIEGYLDEADFEADAFDARLTHDEVFASLKGAQ